jgi:hypothetical protein
MNSRVVVRNYDKGAEEFPFLAVAAGKGASGAPIVSAPWDVSVLSLSSEEGEDAESGARRPWSNRLTVSDHGPATHGLHVFVVSLTEAPAEAPAEASAEAPDGGLAADDPELVDDTVAAVPMTVTMHSEQAASYGAGKPGNAPGMLDCPRGSLVISGDGGGAYTLVVDCQNNSLVLLTPEAAEV